MKYSFISDIHGADIKKVYKTIRPYVNLFIILGDLDRTRAAEQVNELLKNDPGVYFVPGNHDYSHINHELIYSGMMNKQEINSLMMWEEWDNSPELSKLISSSFDNSFKEKYPNYKGLAGRRISLHLENGEKMILMHGAYDGDYQGEPSDLWNRLGSKESYKKNFKVMEQKGYSLMVRGHDHEQELAFLLNGGEVDVLHSPRLEYPIDITNAEKVTITAGSLHDGYLAILDDTLIKRTITFSKDNYFAFSR